MLSETTQCYRNKHDGLGKDNGHNAGSINFQGYILTCAAVLAVADNALCILHGNLACSLHQKHCPDGHCKQEY